MGGPIYRLTGMMPDLHLVNNRPANQSWLIGFVVALVIGILTFLKIATS